MNAVELTQASVKKFVEGELDASAKKFEEALTICPTAGQARDWKSKVEVARHDTTTAATSFFAVKHIITCTESHMESRTQSTFSSTSTNWWRSGSDFLDVPFKHLSFAKEDFDA
eukprot:COSAG02_NODE_19339_length_886_cov_3.064803_1_plen_114_part_00